MEKLSYDDEHFLEMIFCEDWEKLFFYCEFHIEHMSIRLAKWQTTGLYLQLNQLEEKRKLEKLTQFILNV